MDLETGKGLVSSLRNFFRVTSTLLDSIQSSSFPSVDCGVSLDTFRRKFNEVAEQALVYTRNVAELCRFGCNEDRVRRMRERIEGGDLEALTEFLQQLNPLLERCQESFGGVKAAIEDVLSRAQEAAQTCREKGQKEKSKKNATRAVGGTAAAGALAVGVAGGVVASAILGAFTFGIGAIVGLTITVVGSTVAGASIAAGTGVATHVIASRYAEAERKLMELSNTFEEANSSASRVNESIRQLRAQLELISANLDNVRQPGASHEASQEERASLIQALDRLWQRFEGFDPEEFSQFQRDLETRRRIYFEQNNRS